MTVVDVGHEVGEPCLTMGTTDAKGSDSHPRVLAEALLDDPPLLHHWSGEWQLGGITPAMGRMILRSMGTSAGRRIIETGAGLSTLLFLATDPEKVISIAPEPDLFGRIVEAAKSRSIVTTPLRPISERSELALPRLLESGERFDLALLDGGHGWPTVFVDFCYTNAMLDEEGLIVVDDLQLHSVRQLYLMLCQQPGFERVQKIGEKMAVFRKTTDECLLPDFRGQPFIVLNSDL